MAVSNHDWKHNQLFRNVKEALEAKGDKVKVITTDQGYPPFSGVDDVIDKASIEAYAIRLGLMDPPAPYAEPVTADEAVGLARFEDAEDGIFESCEPIPPAAVAAPETDATDVRASVAAVELADANGVDLADIEHDKDTKITKPAVQAFIDAQNTDAGSTN